MPNTRIIIVEDYEGIRDLLRDLLTAMGLSVIAEAEDGERACELILAHKPDLVILDLGLPDINGFTVVERVRNGGFDGPFLALTGELRPYVVQRIYEMKFAGAVSKRAPQSEWKKGILAVLEGKTYRCRHFLEQRAGQLADPLSPSKLLTNRETEILGLIGLAKSDDEIARVLRISPSTVHGVRTNLMKKLDSPSTPKLVRFSQEKGYAAFGAATNALARANLWLCMLTSLICRVNLDTWLACE